MILRRCEYRNLAKKKRRKINLPQERMASVNTGRVPELEAKTRRKMATLELINERRVWT